MHSIYWRQSYKFNTVFVLLGWNATVDMYSTEFTCKAWLVFWKYCFGYDTLVCQVLPLWWSQYISVLSSFNLIHFILNLFQFQCQVQFQVLMLLISIVFFFIVTKSIDSTSPGLTWNVHLQIKQSFLQLCFFWAFVGHPSCACDLRLDLDMRW